MAVIDTQTELEHLLSHLEDYYEANEGPDAAGAEALNLIAAAPELLAALQDVCEQPGLQSPLVTSQGCWERAAAAIASATGGAS